MNKKNYYLSRDKKSGTVVYFEYDKLDGYQVKPKKKKNNLDVSQVLIVKPEFSEKIIRKKIERKIEYFLAQLKTIDEDNSGDGDVIKRSLYDAEKLRLQIINNYVKYLGHTYQGLTLEKLEIIISQLRYRLYLHEETRDNYCYYEDVKREGRGR